MSEINGTKSDFELLFDSQEFITAQRETIEGKNVIIESKDDLIELQKERIERQWTMLRYLRSFKNSGSEYIERTNEEIDMLKGQNSLLDSRAFKAEKAVLKWIWFTGISAMAAALGLIAHISQS